MSAALESTSGMLDDSHPLTKTVKKIAGDLVQRIEQVTGNKEHLEDKMKFIVISSPQRNAFALPSGHIVVYSGLFNAIDSDHELAGILAHEIGHVLCRHGLEGLTAVGLRSSAMTALGVLVPWTRSVLSPIVGALLRARQQQVNEFEADRIAVHLAYCAGYDPRKLGNALG